MNSRVIMTCSSIYLAALGIVLSFMPQELLSSLQAPASEPLPLLLQLGGAAILGWGIVNWTARGVMVGGIYARPLSLGNFLHFVAGAAALGKAIGPLSFSLPVIVILVGHSFFAALFALLMFGLGGFSPTDKSARASHGP